jgi:hypothetical protein
VLPDEKQMTLVAELNEHEFVCGRMHKNVDTSADFRLLGSKVCACVLLLSVIGEDSFMCICLRRCRREM